VTRRRLAFLAAAVATIGVGLLVHWGGGALDRALRDVRGDERWAAMVAWWLGAAAPRARLTIRSAAAYAVCVAVETSQLYHAPWLDALRATRAGHLVLGSGFDPRDLLAYALGVVAAALLEAVVKQLRSLSAE